MHSHSLGRDLTHLFQAQSRRIALTLYPREPKSKPVGVKDTIVVLTHRTGQGSTCFLDVELPTDLTREQM